MIINIIAKNNKDKEIVNTFLARNNLKLKYFSPDISEVTAHKAKRMQFQIQYQYRMASATPSPTAASLP
jgi:hypothetical protein